MNCIVENCKNLTFSKNMCQKHYTRNYRYKDVFYFKQNKDQSELCEVDNCNNKSLSRNLCSSHYARWKRNGDSFNKNPINKIIKYTGAENCIIPNCIKQAKVKMLCKQHYQQQSKHKIKFYEILDDFKNGCFACGSTKDLCLDHDHSVCSEKSVCIKCYRGILCKDCNLAIGQIKENRETLNKLIEYLDKSSKK